MKKLLTIVLTLVMLLSIVACGSNSTDNEPAEDKTEAADAEEKADGDKKVIGISLYYKRDEYYQDLDLSFQKYAEEYGYEVIIQDANADISKQTQQVEDFITKGVDAIALAATDPDGIVPAIEEAVNAGIPVITYDGNANTDLISTFVGFDFIEDGAIVGNWAKEYIEKNLGGQAKVVVIDFPASPITCGHRAKGFMDTVTELEGVEIVAQQDGNATRADSMTAMENIISANPDVDVVYGINFDSAAGANAALEAAGITDVVVTGNGYGREMFEILEAGDSLLSAFACSMPQIQAHDTIEAIDKVLKGEELPKETLSHSRLTTSENIAEFDWRTEIAQ